MNDFYESTLNLKVKHGLGEVYKKAIEEENNRFWVKNEMHDASGNIIKDEIIPQWNGNYAYVEIMNNDDHDVLKISMVSHTLSNLEKQVNWYERMGCEVTYKSY